MMQNHSIEADDLKLLSRSFRYPEEMPDWFALAGIGIAFDPDLETVGLTKLQNEYVRLFINALPQVSCPPYGSFCSNILILQEAVQWKMCPAAIPLNPIIETNRHGSIQSARINSLR